MEGKCWKELTEAEKQELRELTLRVRERYGDPKRKEGDDLMVRNDEGEWVRTPQRNWEA